MMYCNRRTVSIEVNSINCMTFWISFSTGVSCTETAQGTLCTPTKRPRDSGTVCRCTSPFEFCLSFFFTKINTFVHLSSYRPHISTFHLLWHLCFLCLKLQGQRARHLRRNGRGRKKKKRMRWRGARKRPLEVRGPNRKIADAATAAKPN